MSTNVFANSLEISGKAVDAKTLGAFPDVCFTPPENPATPPGVPVPYPSFGFASDTDKGTGTVKIANKTVNIKNQSFLAKTSGTEAGCAAKKGVITSKNTGKEYFNSWSSDVKFDGEPVVRHTDLATNNHASPQANTPPMVHAAQWEVDGVSCKTILTRNDMVLHRHGDSPCDSKKGEWSEHYVENQFMAVSGNRNKTKAKFKNYKCDDAPCLCMHSKWTKGDSKPSGIRNGQTTGTDHYDKSKVCRDSLKNDDPNLGEFTDTCAEASAENHENMAGKSAAEKARVAACLVAVFLAHIQEKINEHRKATGKPPVSIKDVRAMTR
ncbi:DUF4150 domain-containing protein [Mesorhizobium sp. LjNodule214]|uniref:DUF4150 domain-containing protein n=1 Tax=Mesorhizobium sp. LjNodule214 TaxID=3342252 RepID=UPI003ECED6E1